MGTNDPALTQPVEHSLAFSNNPRLYAADHLTRPLESIGTADSLAVIIDVDALGRSPLAEGDRLLIRALDALSHVRVQVVVVAKVAMDRAVALQRGIPRSCCLETERAVSQMRQHNPGLHLIAISNDLKLLARLEPEDRGFTLADLPTSHGMISGQSSMRSVLWWLVSLRGAAIMARRP